MRKKIALLLCIALAVSTLTGCGNLETMLANATNGGKFEEVTSLPLQEFKSKQRVIDDNGKELEYMAHSNLVRITKDTTTDYNKVSTAMQSKLKDAINNTFEELNGKNIAQYDGEYAAIIESLSEDTDRETPINLADYDREYSTYATTYYLKNFFDNYKIIDIDPNFIMKEYSGYYFCTVHGKLAPNTEGTFKVMANYLGLDNCFIRDENRVFQPNIGWIIQSIDAVNKYRESMNLEPHAVFITMDSVLAGVPVIAEPEGVSVEVDGAEQVDGSEASEGEEPAEETPDIAYVTEEINDDITSNLNTEYKPKNIQNAENSLYTENLRTLEYDVDEYEAVNGGSLTYTAMLPGIDMVYNSVQPSFGSSQIYLEGDGCYREGLSGLKNFEFNADELTGDVDLVLIYKQDAYNKDKLEFFNAYVERLDPTNTFEALNNADKKVEVPSFVEEKLKVKIEELDRLINNGDINGLMRHETIEDAGLALRYAQYADVADITTYSSELKRVLASDGNVYLVEVETSVTESVKDYALPVSYKMDQYYVIRQSDLNFYINDIYVASKIITKPPYIEEVSQRYREIVNLNLADNMDGAEFDEIKQEIVSTLLNDWSYSVNTRGLYGANYISKHYGIAKLLNNNREVLSKDRYDYLVSYMMKNMSLKQGRTDARLAIVVTKWLQGTDQQVEFETNELFYYPDSLGQKDAVGYWQHCYYIVSHFRDMWVIDDIKYIETKPKSEEDVLTGADLDYYITSFKDNPDVIDSDKCSDPAFQINAEYLDN